MWQRLHDAWWRLATQHHPQSFSDLLAVSVLHTGSLAYRGAAALRNRAYDEGWVRQVQLPCRVVSVGNLTVGGTGKTAFTELVGAKLLARGQRLAVLSRGYGGAVPQYWLQWENGCLLVNGEPSGPDGLADEPQMLAEHLSGMPVVVGPRRERTGMFACRTFHPDLVILDDGFQHRRLKRDCEIVLVSARMPLGGWRALPRGPMREPLSALSRAHLIVVTKADEALDMVGAMTERLRTFSPDADIVTAAHVPTELVDMRSGERYPPSELAGRQVGLVSSIGDPQGFESTVGRLQAKILWHRAFPDHYRYRAEEWSAVLDHVSRTAPDGIVTTEKDWVRLRRWTIDDRRWTVPLWVLRVQMKMLEGEDVLDARLARVCAR